MVSSNGIRVVFENGVFRPEEPVSIPEHSRLRIWLHEIAPGPGKQSGGKSLAQTLHDLRTRGLIRSGGWRPTRDELHERG